MIYTCILIIIICIIFTYLNNILRVKEHMSMKNIRLNAVLKENGYELDIEEMIIRKCLDKDKADNCFIKKYETNQFNSIKAHNLAKNKPLSNKLFMENNIPVPKHWIIKSNDSSTYKNIGFPCVLKPVDGMQGTDVNTFIKTKDSYDKILKELMIKYKEIMLEEQVYGDNYRIFVFNNTVIDVIKREQPYVIGHDKKTIQQLINEKNDIQKKNNLFPVKNISWDFIEEQGYTKDAVLEKDKKIFITNTINFHNGANPVRVDIKTIPKENIDIFLLAHKLVGLECSGIDYMSADISVPYYENDGHIIEINDMVDTKIHVDADNGAKPNFLFENIIKSFLQNT